MKCRRVRHLLLDFVDGRGSEAEHAEVDRHLADCAECERFASETRRALALLRRAPVEPVDENFNWKVRLAIHRAEKSGARQAGSEGARWRAWNVRYAAGGGVAFTIVLLAGLAVVRNYAPGPVPTQTGAASGEARVQPDPRADVARPDRSSWDQTVVRPEAGGRLVSDSSPAWPSGSTPGTPGAIDRHADEVAIDSLIDARLLAMSEEMRIRFLQRQIHRMQTQLESQQAAARQP